MAKNHYLSQLSFQIHCQLESISNLKVIKVLVRNSFWPLLYYGYVIMSFSPHVLLLMFLLVKTSGWVVVIISLTSICALYITCVWHSVKLQGGGLKSSANRGNFRHENTSIFLSQFPRSSPGNFWVTMGTDEFPGQLCCLPAEPPLLPPAPTCTEGNELNVLNSFHLTSGKMLCSFVNFFQIPIQCVFPSQSQLRLTSS